MTKQPAKPNSKRAGELSEAAFLHKAVSLGFRVTKPWGDSERYDFVIDSGSRLWRVQIKSTSAKHAGGYQIQPIHHVYGERKLAYTSHEIDALAAHIVPLDVWYVLPVSALGRGTSLRFYPDGDCKTARFEHYREAWNLFHDPANPQAMPQSPTSESAAARFDTNTETDTRETEVVNCETKNGELGTDAITLEQEKQDQDKEKMLTSDPSASSNPSASGDQLEPSTPGIPLDPDGLFQFVDGPFPHIETPLPYWRPPVSHFVAEFLRRKKK